jgi:hypothetical protein
MDKSEIELRLLRLEAQVALGTGSVTNIVSLVITGLTTAGLLSGHAAYISAPNVASATDTSVPILGGGSGNNARFVGVYEGVPGQVQWGGVIADAAFTTAGGAPAAGQPVWLAASTDEAGATGKFTATPTAIVGHVLSEVGICIDPSGYAGSKTARILLQPKIPVQIGV